MTKTVEARAVPCLTPDLPVPYFGHFETWHEVESGEYHVVLNVFTMNAQGRQAFLRTFHAIDAYGCQVEFSDWICGLCESPYSD